MPDITDNDQAAALRARLAAIVDSSDDAIVSKTLDGVITSWNKAAERMFGYSAEEAVGKHITLIIPKERLAEEDTVLAHLRRGEKIDHFETRRRTKDGRLLDISLTVSPVRDAAGNIVGASKIARDITEKKRSEERLAASEHYLHAVLATVPECVLVLDASGRVQQVNSAGLRVLEAGSTADVEGRSILPLIDPSGRAAFESALASVSQSGGSRTLEFELTGLRGGHCLLESTIVPMLSIADRPGRVLALTRDIGEHRKLLQQEQSARRTAELLNQIGPVLAAELQPAGLAQKVTDIATQAVGAEFGALFHNVLDEKGESLTLYTLSGVSRSAFEKFPMPRNTAVFAPTFRGESAVRSDDITKDPRYGRNPPYKGMPAGHLPVRSYLSVPVVSRSGAVLGGLFFGHSRTGIFTEEAEQIATGIAAQAAIALDNAALFDESRRAQNALLRSNEELRRANDDLNQFAHSASHDLKEPLRIIAIYSQLLQRKLAPALDSEGLEYLQHILWGAGRMESLIKDLLEYTRASNPSDEPPPVVEAADSIEDALSNLSATIESAGAQVEYGEMPKVRIARIRLTQLFQNLIGNAIKYRRDEPPRVIIAAKQDGSHWLFSVEDNGIGIEADYREQIFGIFKRLHTSDAYSGTGIGLAICQRIVERAGGRIWVESTYGRGSTFFFTLPVTAP